MSEQTGSALSQCDHGVEAWQCRTCVGAEMDYMRDRAEQAERQRDMAWADNKRLREAIRWFLDRQPTDGGDADQRSDVLREAFAPTGRPDAGADLGVPDG